MDSKPIHRTCHNFTGLLTCFLRDHKNLSESDRTSDRTLKNYTGILCKLSDHIDFYRTPIESDRNPPESVGLHRNLTDFTGLRRTSAESLAVDQSPSKYTEVRSESSGLKQNRQIQRTLPDSTGLQRMSIDHRGPPDSQIIYRTYFKYIGLLNFFSDFRDTKWKKAVGVRSESDRTCKKLLELLKTCQTSKIKSKSKYILSYKGPIGVRRTPMYSL